MGTLPLQFEMPGVPAIGERTVCEINRDFCTILTLTQPCKQFWCQFQAVVALHLRVPLFLGMKNFVVLLRSDGFVIDFARSDGER